MPQSSWEDRSEIDVVKLLSKTRQCWYEKEIFQEKFRKRYFLVSWGYVLLGNILHRLKVLSYREKYFVG